MNSFPSKVCLFGGTFDPIHKAHLRVAREAQKAFHLDQVLFVPAGNPPHKQASEIAPFEHRYRMVELACQNDPDFVPSRLEDSPGQSYSIDTVERLQAEGGNPQLFFLIGADAFEDLPEWHRWQDLVAAVEFIVVSRPGHEYRTVPGARVHRLELALPISSSGIRLRLAKGKPTPELPAAVRHYIDQHALYGAARIHTPTAKKSNA